MTTTSEALHNYRTRRDFCVTPEPKGETVSQQKKNPIFVIQKHAARQLHYDLRLEIDGVLASWAIPKGPSLNPRCRRLAVRTENHPMEYAKFEGIIPEGEYGAGTVMIWDKGTYKNMSERKGRAISATTALKHGEIKFFLKGKKLEGEFVLLRTKYAKKGEEWLLVKMKDEYSSARRNPVNTQQKSALTDRTMTQIKREACKKEPATCRKRTKKPARTR